MYYIMYHIIVILYLKLKLLYVVSKKILWKIAVHITKGINMLLVWSLNSV